VLRDHKLINEALDVLAAEFVKLGGAEIREDEPAKCVLVAAQSRGLVAVA
jgi:hypothetical protein